MRLIVVISLLCLSLFATSLRIGETLPFTTLNNQHDKASSLRKAKYWVIVQDKSVSYLVNEYFLSKHQRVKSGEIVYILNIEKIPYFVYHLFVKNKMREFPFMIMICDEETKTARLPYREDKITVIEFDKQRAVKISHVDNNASLDLALGVTP